MEYEESQWSRTGVAQRFALRVSGPALRALSLYAMVRMDQKRHP